MEILETTGIEFILFLQGLGNWLDTPMLFFSFLGNEEFFLLVMPAFYWCISTVIGLRLGLLLLFSSTLNSIIKLALHGPRPFWLSSNVRVIVTESSFGAPSGHAQNATAVWGGLASAYQRVWIWVVVLAVILFTGLSRLYTGVHFPHDVMTGWLIGALILAAYSAFENTITVWWKPRSLAVKLAAAFSLSMVFILLGAAAKTSLGDWTLPAVWVENAAIAYPEEGIGNPLALAGIIGNSGALFGLILGVTLLPLFGGFDAGGAYWKRAARFMIGVIGVLLIWRGLGMLLPSGENLVAFVFRYLRYAMIGAWISCFAPLLFIKMGLATDSRELPVAGQKVRSSLTT
jgi:membrane-associated phospholipid phosphatase